jgi:hypothetical protein
MTAVMQQSRVIGHRAARLLVAAALFALIATVLQPATAYADPHAAIEPRRVALDEPVEAGQQRSLPVLTVTNTGDSPGTFVVEVRSFIDPGATPEEAAWLRVEPAEFELGPGEAREVTITVAPGTDVASRDYRTLVTAGTTDGGVAVATTVEFGVDAPATETAAATGMSLYIVVVGLAALAVGLVVFARRFQFDLDTMRRRRAAAVPVAEPSRSVLLVSSPSLDVDPEPAIEPPPADDGSVRSWMSDFTEPHLELPPRPSVEQSALPLAQLPSRRSERAGQVPLPPPLQPSLPPPAASAAVAAPEAEPSMTSRTRAPSRLVTAGLALGAALALWATVATVMLATRPTIDRGAIDEQIAALEARVESLTAQVGPVDGEATPLATLEQATSTPAAGAPPAESATPLPSLASVVTPEAEANVETVTPEQPTATPTPVATSQAVRAEEPTTEEPEGGETWILGADGARVYVAGPGGGPLDTEGQDLYDCHHFETWAQALAVREASGPDDPNLIDTDGNGLPCESLMAREQDG